MPKGLLLRVVYFLVALVILTELVVLARPLPTLQPSQALKLAVSGQQPALPWPSYGQAAVGALGYGLLDSAGAKNPMPIASVAKIINALAILQKKPLKVDQTGPTLTLGPDDVAKYQSVVGQDGSAIAVANGEQLSEYQALEAMILPSANNMAYSLAVWAFGSANSYIHFANNFVKTLGMDHTTVSDASGFAPQTVSTATDLVKLGIAAMQNPVLAQIVGETSATLPVAGTVPNTNGLLHSDGIIGIKTGNTDQAGGCYLVAAHRLVNNQEIITIAAVMNAPDLFTAMRDGRQLIIASDSGFQNVTIVKKGQVVGTYKSAWGRTTSAVAAADLTVPAWQGQTVTAQANLKPVSPSANSAGLISSQIDGRVTYTGVVLQKEIAKPSLGWRLLHPYL